MEPLTLAGLVVTALTSFATGLGSGAADKVMGTASRVVELIRERFGHDEDTMALVDEVSRTASEPAEERLTLRIARTIAEDPQFAEALERALAEPEASRIVQASDVGVAAGGDVRIKGRYVAGRDLRVEGAADAD